MARNIVLTGFMGSGKTSVGKITAANLGYDFIDIDSYIEEKHNKKISEIFKEKGEDYFRNIETDAVNELAGRENTVIATGGGTVIKKENIKALRKNGVIIFLYCDASVVMKRVGKDESRPLLKDKTERDIENMINHRREFYQNNDYEIDVSAITPIEVAKKVVVNYNKFKEKKVD